MPFRRFVPTYPAPAGLNNQNSVNVQELQTPRNQWSGTKAHAKPLPKSPQNARRSKRQGSPLLPKRTEMPTSLLTEETSEGLHSRRNSEIRDSSVHSPLQVLIDDELAEENSPPNEEFTPDILGIPRLADTPTDPFGQIKIPMNSERYALLQYFITTFLPVNLGPGNPYIFPHSSQKRRDLIRDCLSAPVHTYALLTAASARVKYFGGKTLPEAYAYLTIRQLRHQLSSVERINQPLLCSIAFLRTHAVYDGRWEVVDHHDKLLNHLIETVFGGFHKLDPLLRQILWYADRAQAAATGRKPMFNHTPRLNPIPEQLYGTILRSISRYKEPPMGQAFCKLYDSFDISFQHTLTRTIRLAHFLQHYWSRREPQLDRDLLIARGFELLDSLHHADHSEDILAHTGAGIKLQQCLRIALIVWLTLTFHPMSFIPEKNGAMPQQPIRIEFDVRPLQQSFTEALEEFDHQPLPTETHYLLLWVAALGVLAFKSATCREWFGNHFRTMWAELESPQQKFTEICYGYLWLSHIELCRGIDMAALLTNLPNHQFTQMHLPSSFLAVSTASPGEIPELHIEL